MEIYVWSGAGVLAVAFLVSLQMHVLQHRRIAKLGDRMAHLSAGISLLTDTVEGGLRDVAQEIERLGAAKSAAVPKPKTRAATQRRVSTAARRGRSVQDIAAQEKMSEGEVRLRLQMAGAAVGKEKAHATMR